MVQNLNLGGVIIEIIKRDIKNVHLSVLPPSGRVRISAPHRMNLANIRLFAISKLSWIKKQQKHFLTQKRETQREYIERESHYLWGKRYLLHVEEKESAPVVKLKHSKIVLQVRPASKRDIKRAAIERWYRDEVRAKAEPLIAKWEKLLKVKVKNLTVRKMRTRWGSCNSVSGGILLNTELAKKSKACLEYVVVHEMIHLLERSHNKRFISLMDKFMPLWRHEREMLNNQIAAY